jgi:transcriptional regulator with XRE-family HTH domain
MAEFSDGDDPDSGRKGSTWVRNTEDLGRLLRQLRRREARRRDGRELTYRELAGQTGWSHASIGQYFTGRVLPPTDRFDALVRLLGATPAEQGAMATARDRIEDLRRKARAAACDGPARTPPQRNHDSGEAAQALDEPPPVIPRQLPLTARH